MIYAEDTLQVGVVSGAFDVCTFATNCFAAALDERR